MRELSNDGVVRGSFVLVTGDLVSNMDLRAAMEAHQQNRAVVSSTPNPFGMDGFIKCKPKEDR